MMSDRPMLIEDDNLTRAWVRAFVALTERGVDALMPLVVTVQLPGDGQLPVVPEVVKLIDAALAKKDVPSSHTTANTIFPSLWDRARPRQELYQRYRKMLPRLRKHRRNHYGIY